MKKIDNLMSSILRYNSALHTQEAGPLNPDYSLQHKGDWLKTAAELDELGNAAKELSRNIRRAYEHN